MKANKNHFRPISEQACALPKTPKEIAEETAGAINNVSNYLSTLRKLGLAVA
jgi:DNA-binding CsgD family transcriptional regulator